jgi:hemoglobin/transferrin/lactoferrin receptor protein
MLRGFEASRVLLMVDGIRMNNLIYRAGHLQNAVTIDNNMLDHAEVLFGPSSTVYGSDALGGVIHFYTRNPELSAGDNMAVSGNSFIRYGSVNEEKTGHIDFNLGWKKFASLTSFTFSDFGDLKMGEKTNPALGEQFGLRTQYAERAPDNSSDLLVQNSNPFKQVQSGYKQWDLLQKFLFKPSDRVTHMINFQYSNSTNVPRYDRLTDPDGAGTGLNSAEWYYGPQKRLLVSYQLKVTDLGVLADAMTATVSYQSIQESRHNRGFGAANRTDRTEDVGVMGLTVDFLKKIGSTSMRYGIDGQPFPHKAHGTRTATIT